MAANETQSAARPPLRWYQFSLSGLFVLTSFLAVFLSVLAVGWTFRGYDASVIVQQFSNPWLSPPAEPPAQAEVEIDSAIAESIIDVGTADSLRDAVIRSLRQKGIESIDGEAVSRGSIRSHVAVTRNDNFCEIAASSNDQKTSRSLAATYAETWCKMLPDLVPVIAEQKLTVARKKFAGPELKTFDEDWQHCKESGYFVTPPKDSFSLLVHDSGPQIVRTYPHWNTCIAISGIWLILGLILLVVNLRWRYHNLKAQDRDD
jgi:hypothetical protein